MSSANSMFVMLNGDPHEVTEEWIQRLPQEDVLRIAHETGMQVARLANNPPHAAWFAVGVLTDTDRAQDIELVRRLSLGMVALERIWPMTTQKAQRLIKRSFRR